MALGASRVPGTPGVSEELPCPPQNSVALASIQLPPSLFSTPPAALAPPAPPDCTLQLLVFRNGRLFRTLGNTSRPGATGPGRRRGVATPVIFAGTSKGLRPALPHSGGGPGPRPLPRPAWPCPHPWRQGTVAPRPVSEDDAGQGRPVKEGTGGEKAPRTRGFTSQTPHISEGLQAQTHVGLPLLPGVCQLPPRVPALLCPPFTPAFAPSVSPSTFLSSTPKFSLPGHVTVTPLPPARHAFVLIHPCSSPVRLRLWGGGRACMWHLTLSPRPPQAPAHSPGPEWTPLPFPP